MTAEAPAHRKRVDLFSFAHLIDAPMARLARNSVAYVHAVMKIDESWKPMHRRPPDRLAECIAGAQWLQDSGALQNLRMAGEAGLSGRHAGVRIPLRGIMAESTIYSDAGNVKVMRKWDGLHCALTDTPEPIGTHEDITTG